MSIPASPAWVFGYGSLIWHQDFPFIDARRAQVENVERRFWQGSHDHRGTPEAPGRVVTLIDSPGAVCIGRAFLVKPEVFAHLDHRERNGYERRRVDITMDGRICPGVTYLARASNPAFLGDAPPGRIASQIARCSGPSGSNLEYLLELAAALRKLGADDPHVFELESLLAT